MSPPLLDVVRDRMVFMCAFCRLLPEDNGRRNGPGKLALRDENLPASKMLLKQQWPRHTAEANSLEASKDASLCLQCMPQEQRANNITRVVNCRKCIGALLVGQPVAQWMDPAHH